MNTPTMCPRASELDHNVHPFMVTTFPESFGTKCHPETKRKWFRNHSRGKFKMTTWTPDSPDLSLVERLWDLLDKQVRSMEKLQELKGSAANCLVPDTRAHHQGSSGVQVSMDQGCFGSKRGTNMISGRWSHCRARSVCVRRSRSRSGLVKVF